MSNNIIAHGLNAFPDFWIELFSKSALTLQTGAKKKIEVTLMNTQKEAKICDYFLIEKQSHLHLIC